MKIVSQACSCIPLSNQHIGSFFASCSSFFFYTHTILFMTLDIQQISSQNTFGAH